MLQSVVWPKDKQHFPITKTFYEYNESTTLLTPLLRCWLTGPPSIQIGLSLFFAVPFAFWSAIPPFTSSLTNNSLPYFSIHLRIDVRTRKKTQSILRRRGLHAAQKWTGTKRIFSPECNKKDNNCRSSQRQKKCVLRTPNMRHSTKIPKGLWSGHVQVRLVEWIYRKLSRGTYKIY